MKNYTIAHKLCTSMIKNGLFFILDCAKFPAELVELFCFVFFFPENEFFTKGSYYKIISKFNFCTSFSWTLLFSETQEQEGDALHLSRRARKGFSRHHRTPAVGHNGDAFSVTVHKSRVGQQDPHPGWARLQAVYTVSYTMASCVTAEQGSALETSPGQNWHVSLLLMCHWQD